MAQLDGSNRTNSSNLGPSVIPAWTPMYDGMRLRAPESFKYWKLHGSTNWYWDSVTRAADSIVNIGVRYQWNGEIALFNEDEREFRAPGKQPMIVPPTTGKSVYFNNPVIRYLWHDAFYGLLQASRIFVFGYSLPPSDVLVRSLLSEALTNKEVWLVNPSRAVIENFSGLTGNLQEDFCGPDLDPEAFVRRYRGLVV